ncbi:MAG: hypothetical protein B7Z73_11265, partial [Planctomycetia bacterium 21-64-5]
LLAWLGDRQPCLFGRMEARQRRLAFCILTENDLERSDQEIRGTIHRERADWRDRARTGATHGFLIVAVAERIAYARPGPALQQLASALCSLYLNRDESDTIHHDEVMLEIRDDDQIAERRRWKVGVNYFSAQADGRWWSDHRIPGGMAFSMNSVGHMARARAEQALARSGPRAIAEGARERLVYWALPTAMRTIGPNPTDGDRGTWLVEHGTFDEDIEPPTFEMRHAYSHHGYHGRYHTDITIPSDYFKEWLWKLEEIGQRDDLLFTYLHSLSDADYEAMGIGEELGLLYPMTEASRARTMESDDHEP